MSTRGSLTPMTMSDGARIGVYHVQPVGARKGGLVLIQEIFGITPHIQQQCDLFAEQGYEVMAPALFDREAPGLQLGRSPDEMQQAIRIAREQHPFKLSLADTQTCIDALKARGPVYLTGYCYGGSVTWGVACQSSGLAAASAYYGSQIPAMVAQQPQCPTILHFGRLDASIPMDAVEKVKAAHPSLPVHIYEASHGFNGDGPHHDDAAAQLAWERTLAHFQNHH
ncbi:dienelactone hydrolase family protein [Sphaerotilaceae bacterium SBD11-9]